MQLSIREAKARLSEAIVAMEAGEQVILTRNGRVVAEISPPPPETKKGNILAALRRSPLVGADLDTRRVATDGRALDL